MTVQGGCTLLGESDTRRRGGGVILEVSFGGMGTNNFALGASDNNPIVAGSKKKKTDWD